MTLFESLCRWFKRKPRSVLEEFWLAKARFGIPVDEARIHPATRDVLVEELSRACRYFVRGIDKQGEFLLLNGIRVREDSSVKRGEWQFSRRAA
jgi:hypothetical protein